MTDKLATRHSSLATAFLVEPEPRLGWKLVIDSTWRRSPVKYVCLVYGEETKLGPTG